MTDRPSPASAAAASMPSASSRLSPSIGRRPEDAAAFVESVERATNGYLTDVIFEIFAEDARVVTITDGGRDEHVGVVDIHRAWVTDCATFKAHRFKVEKLLIAATEDTIVNDWRGGPNGRREGCGIEVWTFDHEGKVIQQRLYSYLMVRSTTNPLQVLRLLLTSPRFSLTAGWMRLRARQ